MSTSASPDWLQRYPAIQALIQQPGDILEGVSAEDDVPDGIDAISLDEMLAALGTIHHRRGQAYAGLYTIRTALVREGHYVTMAYLTADGLGLSAHTVVLWSPTLAEARVCQTSLVKMAALWSAM
jgi:hypothetical protein